MLIFYRGVSIGRKKDLFMNEKLDLLVTYLIVEPCLSLYHKLTKKDTPSKKSEADVNKGDEEEVETVRRVTLRELMPSWRVVMGRLFFAESVTVQKLAAVTLMALGVALILT